MDLSSQGRAHWSSRLVFVLAATGSAVGLGNIWKFPYITGEYGGGAFVLMYLLCIALVGLPLMIAEVMVGRRGDTNPGESFARLARENGHSRHWSAVGLFGIATAFLILTFYSVIGGWALAYLWHALGNAFSGAGPEGIGALFENLLARPGPMIFWHFVFMSLAVGVVARGLNRGIERTISVLMPAMFALLLVLLVYAVGTPGFGRAVAFMFDADFSRLGTDAVLTALGHAFFTLSLGMSVMVAYGSYLPRHISIGRAAITVSILDTLVALGAGLAIFSIVFSNGLEAESGPGLVFRTLPLAFSNLAGGYLLGVAFFFMLVFAAWSSAISLTEPVVERIENHTRLRRPQAALAVGCVAWLLGLLSVLSFNRLADFKPGWLLEKTVFDFLDYITTNVMLPLTGVGVTIFCGWIVSAKISREELELGARAHRLWFFVLRWVSPLLVLLIFAYGLGWMSGS